MIPVAGFAVGGTFTDDDTSIFEAEIEWLASAGVTLGCNPPANDNFCPDDNVTRGQMAAFMRRLAGFLDVDGLAALVAQKANAADVYTKTEADAVHADKANSADVYTKAEVDSALADKADLPSVTYITYTGSTSNTPGDFEKVRDLGTFTKVSSTTFMKLTWQSHIAMTTAGVSCAFHLRIDDLNSQGGTSFDGTEAIINSAERTAVSVVSAFAGLGEGSHTVSLWVRGVGSPTCQDNGGNFTRSVLAEEISVAGGTITVPAASPTESPANDS